MKFKQYTLDPFQEDAIKAIESNHSVVVSAPTGSGKTLIADYIIEKHKNDTKKIIYTAPIKALSNQKYKDFSREYGSDKVGLITGDIVINHDAPILIMTTEIYRNMVVSKDSEINNIAYVIFDEIHYINDFERGYVWEESIIYSPEKIRFLCLSATIPNAEEFSNWIEAIKKHKVITITASKRNVPLVQFFYDTELGLSSLEKIKSAQEIPHYNEVYRKKGKKIPRLPPPDHIQLIKEIKSDKLPCLFFHFSRHACQQRAQELARKNFFPRNPDIIPRIHQKLSKAPPEVSKLESTQILRDTLPQGIAFHHAGLLPVLKELVEELFSEGLIKVLYVTETFAVGINMPAKTVCFESLRKYDGYNFRTLNTKEYFQIAGRAGRRGIDEVGYVIVLINRQGFNYKEIKRVTTEDVEPIISQFKLSINTILNLVDQHTEEEIEHILRMSFYSYQQYGQNYYKIQTKVLLSRYYSILRKLNKLDYIKSNHLTNKGHFSARIFADEITMGEIFATDFAKELDEYQILLVLAALVYEYKDGSNPDRDNHKEQLRNLFRMIHDNDYLKKERKLVANLHKISWLINPLYEGESFFDILKNTDLLEGDIIRIYAQIIDRIGQILKSNVDYYLRAKLENCQSLIKTTLEGVYLV